MIPAVTPPAKYVKSSLTVIVLSLLSLSILAQEARQLNTTTEANRAIFPSTSLFSESAGSMNSSLR